MHDIERIQKINDMSAELKNFGFANNSEEGSTEAQKMYLSEEQQNNQVFSGENKLESLHNNFSRFREMTNNKIQELSRVINAQNKHINKLTQKVSTLQNRREAPQPKPSPQPQQQSPSQTQQAPQEQAEEKPIRRDLKENKPGYYEKQGHYQPGDVVIEDVFYYGNK